MSDGVLDWGALSGGEQEFARANFSYVYDEARAQAIAQDDLALLESYYNRRGAHFSGLSQIIEFGAELTRGSDWLSQAGALDITDIVAPEIYAAYDRLKTKQINNTKLVVLRSVDDIVALKQCDLLYSVLSVRHVPATVIAHALGLLLNKVIDGGVALIRAPTQHKHYQAMLQGAQELEELNVIPQWKLFDLLESYNFALVLVQEEPLFRSADLLYHTVLAQRRS
jgi:hypothetical protein